MSWVGEGWGGFLWLHRIDQGEDCLRTVLFSHKIVKRVTELTIETLVQSVSNPLSFLMRVCGDFILMSRWALIRTEEDRAQTFFTVTSSLSGAQKQ